MPAGFDFTGPELFAKRLPHPEWTELRKAEPIHWVEIEPGSDGFKDNGYWLATKHEDIREISRLTNEYFETNASTAIPRFTPGMDDSMLDMIRLLLINYDGEEHKIRRRTISKGFTPRYIRGMREALQARAKDIVERAAEKGSGDFIVEVSSELPLQAIAELLGIPQEDRFKVFEWSNKMAGYDDPEIADESHLASAQILEYAMEIASQREAEPQDDLISKLVHADVDGGRLTSDEFGWFFILLAFAGNETTRNATTHGMIAFLDNPEQWELFKSERPETAYDEILRWATPVIQFQRTAIKEIEIGGKTIKPGERVVMAYGSANFDEDVFDKPFEFDITRENNPHVTFGGNGPHYCIGANLAKLQIELIFNAIADYLPDLTTLGDHKRLRSGWLNGITEWPVDFCPAMKVAKTA
ncbi:cytochrome P450 [Dietzia sp.]|uniref:cytochrome P450 n=1 Tax=Dietzia sp. TaxID=1871616 RepID=UPI002FD888F3